MLCYRHISSVTGLNASPLQSSFHGGRAGLNITPSGLSALLWALTSSQVGGQNLGMPLNPHPTHTGPLGAWEAFGTSKLGQVVR